MPLKLNLGAFNRRFPGFLSVDIAPPADVLADLTQPWPWPDSSVDEVYAFDVFEHLPDKNHTMRELWRVLKPGGRASIEVPCAAHGAGAWQDPTHVSFWTGNDFMYWQQGCAERERFRSNPLYAKIVVGDFKVLDPKHENYAGLYDEVWKFKCTLEAIK